MLAAAAVAALLAKLRRFVQGWRSRRDLFAHRTACRPA